MALKAIVTGGAGFLGSHLCARLLAEGYQVLAVDNLYTGTRVNLAACVAHPNFTFLEADISEPGIQQTLFTAFGPQIDEIYNLACPASPVHYQAKPLLTMKTSVLGMISLLELARQTGANVLHASTSEIYGDPLVHPQEEHYWGNVNTIGIRSCYDEGKRCAETLCADYRREYGVDTRMVRIFNTYGPHMHPQDGRVISNFIMQALNNEDLTLYGDGEQTRSFQYCDDLIEAMRRYMSLDVAVLTAFCEKHKLGTPVINTGNPGEYTIRELAEETLRQLPESTSKMVFRPLPSDDPKRRKPDITLAKELLGWEPRVPLQEGLAKTIAYFKGRKAEA